jgi:hypothetical protein
VNKKLAIIAVGCVIIILLGGIQTTYLYGTQYLTTKPGYGLAVGETAKWWDCNWSYCKKITIDHTKVQAGQTDFPVLLSESSDADLATYAQNDGDDIVFVDEWNVTQYQHELEKFDGGTGELVAWVEVSTLYSTKDTVIYMYYGNPDCSSQQNITGTWNSNFALVQHLREASGTVFDSTSNNNDGTPLGGVSQNVVGKIDGAVSFDSPTEYIDSGTSSSLNITGSLTLEGWVQDPPLKQPVTVRIVDKKQEQREIIPFKQFTIERTITSSSPTDVTFVALLSPGVTLQDMTVDGVSVFAGTYTAGQPASAEEQRIDAVRTKLPSEVTDLQVLAYSKSFNLEKQTSIVMQFQTWDLKSLISQGRISYVVLSSENTYDVECTTHWHVFPALTDWWNPFSVFKGIIEFFTGIKETKIPQKNTTSDVSLVDNFWFTPKLPDKTISEQPLINYSKFWKAFPKHTQWSLEGWNPSLEQWVYLNNSLQTLLETRGVNARKVTLRYNASMPMQTNYRLTFSLDYPLVNCSYDNETSTYELTYMVYGHEVAFSFDVSDLMQIPGLQFSNGTTQQNDGPRFWFRVTQDNVTSGSRMTLDPSYLIKVATTNLALDFNSQRKLARTSDWALHCVFYDTWSTKSNIRYAKSTDNGSTWTVTNITQDASYNQMNPAIAVDSSNNIHIVWKGPNAAHTTVAQIRYVKYSGGAWGAIANLTDQAWLSSPPAIAVDSNDVVHVVFAGRHVGSTGYAQIRYCKYTGGAWTAPINITVDSVTNNNNFLPSIAVDSNNNLHVVWYGGINGFSWYKIRYSTYNGVSWSSPANISEGVGTYQQTYPSIAVDSSNNVHVVWTGYIAATTNTFQIRYIKKTGSTWGTIVNITNEPDGGYHQYRPSIAVDTSDYIHLVWSGYSVSGPSFNYSQIRCANLTGSSTSWSAAQNLTANNTADQIYPNVLMATYPVANYYKIDAPKTGFCFIYLDGYKVTYHKITSLTWQQVDTTVPTVSFSGLTPANNTRRNNTWVNVSLSTSDEFQHYTFTNFDRGLKLWMRMDNISTTTGTVQDDTEDSAGGNPDQFENLLYAYDENWNNFADAMDYTCPIYINYTVPSRVTSATDEIKIDADELSLCYVDVYCKNQETGSYDLLEEYGSAGYFNISIPSVCIGASDSTVAMKFVLTAFDAANGYPLFYEDKMKWSIANITVVDESGYKNNGTGQGDAAQTNNGYFGKAFIFDGTGDYITLGTSAIVSNKAAFTISTWFKTSSSSEQVIYSETGGGLGYLTLETIGDELDAFYADELGNSNSLTAGGFGVNNNKWHHAVFVKSASNDYKLYFDGSQVQTDTTNIAGAPTVSYVDIGLWGAWANCDFSGSIDDVLLLDRALSLTEIKTLYNATTNHYYHNFTSLANGRHNMTANAVDRAGNKGYTATQYVTVDTVKPSIVFSTSTPATNSYTKNAWIDMGLTTSDTNQHYSFTNFNNSLKLWMRMDDLNSTSNPQEISGNANNGIKHGHAVQTQNGSFGKGFTFDGNGDDYIYIPTSSSLNTLNDGDTTVNIWYKKTDTSWDRGLFTFAKDVNNYQSVTFYTESGAGYFCVGNILGGVSLNAYFQYTSSFTSDLNVSHLATFIFHKNSSNSVDLYYDGAYKSSQNMGNKFANLTDGYNMAIGILYQDASHLYYPFKGSLDDCTVFNRALKASEIKALYNASANQYTGNITGLTNRNYNFTGYTVDCAENKNQTETRTVTVDTLVPTSSVNTISPYNKGSSPQTITATASDTGESGLKNVTLYYRHSTDNATWNKSYEKYTVDQSSYRAYSKVMNFIYEYQTFHVGTVGNNRTFQLRSIKFYINKSTNTTTGTLYSYIYATNSTGYPTGTSLVTSSGLSATSISYYPGWLTMNFSTGTFLQAGTTYAIGWSGSMTSGNIRVWYDNASSAYAGGYRYSQDVSFPPSIWARYTVDDYLFNVTGDWIQWTDTGNPDTHSPWSWSFNFPNSTGYYDFYSIAKDNATNAESAPSTRDAICNYNSAPYVDTVAISCPYNFTLDDLTGSGTYHDADSDPESGSSYNWYESATGTGSWTSLSVNSTTLDSNYTKEMYFYMFEYTPRNSHGSGTPVNSSSRYINNSLTVNAGTYSGSFHEDSTVTIGNGGTCTISGTLVCVGQLLISSGGSLNLGTHDHTFGSLKTVGGSTLTATSGTINITSKTSTYAVDLDGSLTNNSGTIKISSTAGGYADLIPSSSGTPYNVIIYAGSGQIIPWLGNTVIGGDLTVSRGTFYPDTATYSLTVVGNVVVNGGTLGSSSSANWTFKNINETSGTISAPSGTINITGKTSGGYAVDLDGTFTSNSGTMRISTNSAASADLIPSSGTIYNLLISTVSGAQTISWIGSTTTVSGTLTVTIGTFQPGVAANALTVSGDVTVNGGTLGGNSASGLWTLRDLTLSSGTVSATRNYIRITGETGVYYAVDLDGTYTNNSGTIEIQTNSAALAGTKADLIASSGTVYDLFINTQGGDKTVNWEGNTVLGNRLNITNGVFRPNTASDTLTVTGDVFVNGTGSVLGGNSASGLWILKSLSVAFLNTVSATTRTIRISGKTGGGYAVDLDGTYTNNSGTLEVRTGAATTVDLIPSSGTVYNLFVNTQGSDYNVGWEGNTVLGNRLNITNGVFRPNTASDTLTVTGDVFVNGSGSTLGGNSASGLWILKDLSVSALSIVFATTSTIRISGKTGGGYAVNLDGTYTNNSGTLEIRTAAATTVDLMSTGTVYNLFVNTQGSDYNVGWEGNTVLGNRLNITNGVFLPNTATDTLTVTGDVFVNGSGSILGGNSASGLWILNSLSLASGNTVKATTSTIRITGQTGSGYAVNLDGTYTNNSGTLEIQTDHETKVDLKPSSDTVYNLFVNTQGSDNNVAWEADTVLGNRLNITNGVFLPNTASNSLTVAGNVYVNGSGSQLGSNSASGAWIMKSLTLASGNTVSATSDVLTITGKTAGGYSVDLDGTYTNNSGRFTIQTNSNSIADLMPHTGTIYYLTIDTQGGDYTVDWEGNTTISDVVLISNGIFQPHSAADTLTVPSATGSVSLSGSGSQLGGNSASGLWILASLTLASGNTVSATTNTIRITHQEHGCAVDLDGNYTNNSGTLEIQTNAATLVDLIPSSGSVYNLFVNTQGSDYNVTWEGNTIIGNRLNISNGVFRPNAAGNTLTVTGDVFVNGSGSTLGGNSASGLWILNSLSLASGNTVSATTGNIRITGQTGGSHAVDLDGTYTSNSGTIQINTTRNTVLDIAPSSGSIYDLTINDAGNTVTSDEAGSYNIHSLTIQAGSTFNHWIGVMTMGGVLSLGGALNILSGSINRINLSSTVFNLTDATNIALHTTPTTPADPSGFKNIGKYVNLTSCGLASSVDLNITYTDGNLSGLTENTLGMYEFNETTHTWTLAPGSGVNPTTNHVWANDISSYSIYSPLYNSSIIVLTNGTTGVEETNATIHGYLQYDAGESCTVRFEYGTNTSYGTNTTDQTKAAGEEFSANISSDSGGEIVYERYINSDAQNKIYGTKYVAQTFTIGSTGSPQTHNITSVKILAFRTGRAGKLFVSIQEIDGDGNPDNNELTGGSIDSTDLTEDGTGEWAEIEVAPYELLVDRQYALVVSAPDGGADDYVNWKVDTMGTYDRGNLLITEDGGDRWDSYTDQDCAFKEYGIGTNAAANLTPGTLYHYRAYAENSYDADVGADQQFLTKPEAPTSLHAQTNNSTKIYLTWVKGAGANNTIIQRKKDSYPTSISDGYNVYNGTLTYAESSPLAEGDTYYYRAWSYAYWTYNGTTFHQWSDANVSTFNTTNRKPMITNPAPTNGSTGISLLPRTNITVNDRDGNTMTITWSSNSSGSWVTYGTNSSCANGTYRQRDNNFSSMNTKYYWKIVVNDGKDTNSTWYYFTTLADTTKPDSSVNTITPYWKTSQPQTFTGTASDTGGSGLKNVTLWYRYRATNSSSWGGWVSSGLVDTDPWISVSWSFTFSNGTGHYNFYSIARDNASNVEDAPETATGDAWCGYDNVAPSSSVTTIIPYVQTTSPLTLNATASDATSGVKNVTLYYRYSINNASWGGNVSAGTDTTSPWSWSFSFSNGTGYYQFYSIAKDNATNVESAPVSADARCGYSTTPPSSSVNAITPYWKTSSPQTFTGSATDNSGTGLKNVTLWWRFSPDNSSWGGWTRNGYAFVDTTPWSGVSWSFSFPNGTGHYQFYSIAVDNATGTESAPGSADVICGYDNVAPSSSVAALSPYWKTSSPTTITATASDGTSGVKNVTLYYRYSADNTSWDNSWWNKSWSYRKLITINHSQVPSTLTNFPILYAETTDSNLASHAQADGDDICFVLYSDNSTKLNHEIEQYTSGTGKLLAWINVTSLSSSTDTKIWMYYGNSGCSNQQNIPGTWDSGYVGVYHFSEGSGSAVRDSTNHNNGTLLQTDHWNTSGILGTSYSFDGSDDGVILGYINLTKVTMEVWFNVPSWHNYQTLIDKEHTSYAPRYIIEYNSKGRLRTKITTAGGTYQLYCAATKFFVNHTIFYAASSYDGETIHFYVNGSINQVAPGSENQSEAPSGDILTSTKKAYIGYCTIDATHYFWGTEDEVRLSNIARSQPWLKATYNTIKNGTTNTFTTTGGQQACDWSAWSNASNPDSASPWSWNFNFPDGTGYYQFYSIAKDNATNTESAPGTADAMCQYQPYTNQAPVQSNPQPSNQSSCVDTTPQLRITVSDPNGDTMNLTWWSNSSGTWHTFGTNLSVGNGTYRQTNTNFSQFNTRYYWSVNLSDGNGGWSNHTYFFVTKAQPTQWLRNPHNQSTGNTPQPHVWITINTSCGYITNVYFSENTTGNWVIRQTNTSVGSNTSVYWTYTQASHYSRKYWFRVNTTGSPNVTKTYWFTTKNAPPTISNPSPANGSSGVSINPTLSALVNDSEGNLITIEFWTNASGSWAQIGTQNTSASNGTYVRHPTNMNSNSSSYYWSVNATDPAGSGNWTNVTYHFSTELGSKEMLTKGRDVYAIEINPTGTILSGYVKNTAVTSTIDTSWHYVSLTYDGTTLRLYKDGCLANSTGLSGAIPTTTVHVTAGRYLTGKLDELRISNTARTAAWINTTYLNTNSPATFATFSSQVGVLSAFTYRKQITISHTITNTTLINFPVLISLASDTNLRDHALSDGNDIIFTSSSVSWSIGTLSDKLDHEIEKYDHTTGQLIAWVRIPTLSSTTDTEIYMYYGSPLCDTNRQNPTGVWNSNYMMVQHLKESSGTLYDSTNNNNDGTPVSPVFNSSGKIDGAYDFHPSKDSYDEISVSSANSLNFIASSSYTWEFWVYGGGGILRKGTVGMDEDPFTGVSILLFDYLESGYNHVVVNNNHINEYVSGTLNIQDGWNYIAVTYANGVLISYVNNQSEGLDTLSFNDDTGSNVGLGHGYESYALYEDNGLDGSLDEFRISNIARNESWIAATYHTMNAPGFYISFSTQQTMNPPLLSNPSPANDATGQQLNPRLTITVSNSAGTPMDISFRTNATGTWTTIGTNNSVTNGTYSQSPSTMSSYSTTYWWSVNATNGATWTNHTYHFTTGAALKMRSESNSQVYTFTNTTGNTAWYGADAGSNPPTLILQGNLFNETAYQNIVISDDVYTSTTGWNTTDYPYQTFRFNVSESNITNITISWEGNVDVDNRSENVSIFIWNISQSGWDKFQEADASNDVILTNTTTAISDYVNSKQNNSLYILIISNNGTTESVSPSVLSTDYVELNVCYI